MRFAQLGGQAPRHMQTTHTHTQSRHKGRGADPAIGQCPPTDTPSNEQRLFNPLKNRQQVLRWIFPEKGSNLEDSCIQ